VVGSVWKAVSRFEGRCGGIVLICAIDHVRAYGAAEEQPANDAHLLGRDRANQVLANYWSTSRHAKRISAGADFFSPSSLDACCEPA
jgi:hypothetical protein